MSATNQFESKLPADLREQLLKRAKDESLVSIMDLAKLFDEQEFRIIKDLHLIGIYPIESTLLQQLLKRNLKFSRARNIADKYNFALHYKGRDLEKDLKELGISSKVPRITEGVIINGIPADVRVLKEAGLKFRKFDLVVTHMKQPMI